MRRGGRFFDEAFRVGGEGVVQVNLSGSIDGVGLAIMHLVRCHQAEADMIMRLIIPREI